MERLPDELLEQILNCLDPEPDQIVPHDFRDFLSVEKSEHPSVSTRGSISDVCNFRRVSKRFAEVGARIVYSSVALRFTREEFERLEQLADWPHLAKHVKKFSYFVPYFYDVRTLNSLSTDNRLDLSSIRNKASKQRLILNHNTDLRVLQKAIGRFERLQFVKILRVSYNEDEELFSEMRRLSRTNESQRVIDQMWQDACSHCLRTVGVALQSASEAWTMFYAPHISMKSALQHGLSSGQPLSRIATGLTCLALHFVDTTDIDRELSGLSAAFRAVFTAATKMKSVHIGFSQTTNIPLEQVFHNVQWPKLSSFGVKGWRLKAEEILSISRRHNDTLSGLRLKNVYLKDGGRWRTVLMELKDSMRNLKWLALPGIDYASGPEDTTNPIRTAITGDASSVERSFDDMAGSDHRCSCNESFPIDTGQFGDNGISVNDRKRKVWEGWVVRKCVIHGH